MEPTPRRNLPQACLGCSGCGLWEMAGPQASVSHHQLCNLPPRWPQPCPCPCPVQIECQSSGAAPSHRGCASRVQDAQRRAKSSEVERVNLFLDLTVFFLRSLIFLLDYFLRAILFLLFSILRILKILLLPFFFFWKWSFGPQNHTPRFCARLTLCLPTRPALTPPLITVLGSSHAPGCQAAQAELTYASFTNPWVPSCPWPLPSTVAPFSWCGSPLSEGDWQEGTA